LIVNKNKKRIMTSPATDAKPVTPASTGPDWSKLQGRLKMLYTGPDPMFL
jgi:hypothetical protein